MCVIKNVTISRSLARREISNDVFSSLFSGSFRFDPVFPEAEAASHGSHSQ